MIFVLQRYEKEIIQTNNLSKNKKIQGNNSVRIEKIQRNMFSFVLHPFSRLATYFWRKLSAINLFNCKIMIELSDFTVF